MGSGGEVPQKDDSERAIEKPAMVTPATENKGFGLADLGRLAWNSARGELVGAFAAVVISSGTNLAFPRLLGWMVDLVTQPHGPQKVRQGVALSLCVFSLGSLSSLVRVLCLELGAAKISARLRHDVYKALLKRETAELAPSERSLVGTCLAKDAEDLSQAVCKNAAGIYRGLNSSVGGTILLLRISPQLTFVSLSMLPLIGTGAMAMAKWSKALAKEHKTRIEAAVESAADKVAHLRTVKLYGNEDLELAAFDAKLHKLHLGSRKAAAAEGIFMGGLSLSLNSSLMTVVLYGGNMVRNGAISGGELASFAMLSGMVGLGFSQLSSSFGALSRALAASERVKSFLEDPTSTPQKDERSDQTTPFKKVESSALDLKRSPATIEFEKVSFKYTRDGPEILRSLSFTAKPGKITAIAGLNGQGKTTTLRLLSRLNDGYGGRILWNGVDTRSIPLTSLRLAMSVVENPPSLFMDTIRANILYGDPSASEARMHAAAKLSGLHEMILSLPHGYDTVVGSKDHAELSSGQVQRLVLARSLIRQESMVYVLDEATSSLDGQSEQELNLIMRSLAKAGKTVLVVAHRLSTLCEADSIIVLEDGEIIEQGSHESLLTKGGRYAKLVEARQQ